MTAIHISWSLNGQMVALYEITQVELIENDGRDKLRFATEITRGYIKRASYVVIW